MQGRHTITYQIPNTRAGQALLVVVLLFLGASLAAVLGVSATTAGGVKGISRARSSLESYVLAESLVEDIILRLQEGSDVDENESLSLGGHTATATVVDGSGDSKVITAEGDVRDAVRRLRTEVTIGEGIAFNFGVQTDAGGFVMENNSSVNGNLFSNGTVQGSGQSVVGGSVVSAGPTGLIDGIHATSSAWAHTIRNAEIDVDAYYQVISNTDVGGIEYPGSPDQATTSLPITDEQVAEWEILAETGGTIATCPYEIDEDTTIGPIKIGCDVTIRNNPIITLRGHVWATGTIDIVNKPTLRVDSSVGDESLILIADNPANPLTSGKIIVRNATTFLGSGEDGSYIMLLSQNNSAENGGGERAITIEQSASGDLLLYAGHGEVLLQQSTALKEVTAWRVRLQNSAQVTYESGLANTFFETGPSGSFTVSSWQEVE